MEDKEFIERLEEIINALKKNKREQAESDFVDLYDELFDDYEDDDEYEDDSDEEEDE